MQFDTTDPRLAPIVERLRREELAWLTTVFPSGRPAPSLIWFLWEQEEILVFSQETARVRNIEENPSVAMNFNSNDRGGDVVVIDGLARIDRHHPRNDEVPAYVEKYASSIDRLGMTPKTFADRYSVPIRITPSSVRS